MVFVVAYPEELMTVLLDVSDLRVRFTSRKRQIYAVNGVSFQLNRGETLGIVGESGSGKSVTMLSLLQLLPPNATVTGGTATFMGRDLLSLDARSMRSVRGKRIAVVFQDPMTSLNSVVRIGVQMTEALTHHLRMNKRDARNRAVELLKRVGISDAAARLNDYPHQLSGGMRQRVLIAMALACQPDILIADEPTTALDVTIQAQIVDLMKRLRHELETSIIWITHDLSLIAGLAERVLVMYGGAIVEEAPVEELYDHPRHPYTRGLLQAVPSVTEAHNRRLYSIPGAPPELSAFPAVCPFHPRCPLAEEKCRQQKPTLENVDVDTDSLHRVACWVATRQ